MTSLERVWRAVKFETPDRIPRDLWAVPAVYHRYGDEMNRLLRKYPIDIGESGYKVPWEPETFYEVGTYTDPWGVVLQNGCRGIFPNPVQHPLADDHAILHYHPPVHLVAEGFDNVPNFLTRDRTLFINGGSIRLFERMQWLRGFDRLMLDIAEDNPIFYKIRDMVHEFNMLNLRALLRCGFDGIFIMDDWGSQKAIFIHPKTWRKLFLNCYREMFSTIHAAGKLVFFHSDGYILDIIEDLVQAGADVINCQVTCMPINKISEQFRGRICFWGELNRQTTLPLGTPSDVHAEKRVLVKHLALPTGGLIGMGVAMQDVPLENIEAMMMPWNEE